MVRQQDKPFKHSEASKLKMRLAKLGNKYALGKNTKENHLRWKGDNVGSRSLHKYVRKYFPPPEYCEICNIKPVLDLANRTGLYNREFKNWFYLCRSCHIKQDGRLYRNLKQYSYQLSDP